MKIPLRKVIPRLKDHRLKVLDSNPSSAYVLLEKISVKVYFCNYRVSEFVNDFEQISQACPSQKKVQIPMPASVFYLEKLSSSLLGL